jgi:hypothetical protein
MKPLFASLSAALVVALFAAMMPSSPASAAVHRWTVAAVGAEENPAVSSPCGAVVGFAFDDTANTLNVTATVTGISQGLVTAAHIHRGARGVNGPIIHNLSTVPFTTVDVRLSLSAADVADLRAGNLYFNVHSTNFPGGCARAQLVLPASAAPAATPSGGAAVTPPRTGDAGLAGRAGSGTLFAGGIILVTAAGLFFARRAREA